MKKYSSPYSKPMFLSTLVVYSFLLFALKNWIIQLHELPFESNHSLWYIFGIVIAVLAIVYGYLFQVRGVEIADDTLIIRRMCGKIVIPFNEITSVEHKSSILFDLRICGISGLFGHIGWFWNSKIGKYTAYATDGNSLITIKTHKGVYVISCENEEEMIANVIRRINKSF